MLRPGVGRFTLMPTAAPASVVPGDPLRDTLPAFPCRFTAIGIKLPPMTRKATWPPTEVKLLVAPSGFQLARPRVRFRLPRPSEPRAPNAVPLPYVESGLARSPLIVMPVPPLGLFHTGIPNHWAATGEASNAKSPSMIIPRFIRPPDK